MRRILIADDSPAVRKALVRLLQQNHSVIEAEDGQVAFASAVELRPDLIILDLAMPVMDGLTAARKISSVLPDIPILMYTLYCTPALELSAKKCGVHRLVPKMHGRMLLAAVEELLQAPAKAPSLAAPATTVEMPRPSPEPILAAAQESALHPSPAPKPKSVAS